MDHKDKKPELLAPAGNFEKLKIALAFGADAVYAGIPLFSLRSRINDFNLELLEKAVAYCHDRDRKIYATLNIFAHNSHLASLGKHVEELERIGVDALIIADPGVLAVAKAVWPEAEIHLSTQMNCLNLKAAEFWQSQGVKRVILGREVSLEDIRQIHENLPDLELEYFVHGAMCMAYSGRCFLSKYFTDRSANLGDCVQPCRWPYRIGDKASAEEADGKGHSRRISTEGYDDEFELIEEADTSYILNSKDLCLLRSLKDLRDAGISSFKIEGRAKSAYYQAMVAGIYSRAIEKLDEPGTKETDYLFGELGTKLAHRGYTNGFLTGERGDQNLALSHEKCGWEFCGQVLGLAKLPDGLFGQGLLIKVHNSLKVGDEVEIVSPKYDIMSMRVDKLLDTVTGAELESAHGGQGKTAVLICSGRVPEFSVVRRKLVESRK